MISLWFNKEDTFYFLSSLTSLNSLKMRVNPLFWTLCYLGFGDTTLCFFSYTSDSLKNNGFLICFTHIHVPLPVFSHYISLFYIVFSWFQPSFLMFLDKYLLSTYLCPAWVDAPYHHLYLAQLFFLSTTSRTTICFLGLISWLSPRPCKDSILHSDPCSFTSTFFLSEW